MSIEVRRSNAAPSGETERGGIQSIDRAANVLALLDQDTRSLTPAVVAERLGLNRTTAHRYLQSLQTAGFLSTTYGPGPLLDQLSALVSERQQILTLAPAVLRQLSDSTDLTTVLSFLGRTGAVVTLVEEAHRGTIILTVRVGTVLEPKAAQTRALLAFATDPAAVTRGHAVLGPAEAALEREALTAVRRQGIAWAELHGQGLASVAAPVFVGNEASAAMALIGTSTMLQPLERSARRVQELEEAAQTLGTMVSG
ncbi:IclR family transcriptional regulator [Streptomyces sp. B3I8]|jgi:DNA-binding IclR family transcriptional regulator|uniref:IclR family transcriptional regulator n=1 Tax=Streptomyces sp. B3I8 TaxID=3042303 RepID=UPI002789AB3A|nr:helix-turn-helix domain-containing protein [Streptomyces sp. B3I8]MDQ0791140.1 DNA-binding IclR family transcriptional regulator [Streptomyces sp. B3I8]